MSDSPRTARVPSRPAVPYIAATGELFNSKQQIESSHTSELVIALCGPIGSPIRAIGEALREQLVRDFAYEECNVIRLSQYIETHTESAKDLSALERVRHLISHGDGLRMKYGASILAEFAISQIALNRQRERSSPDIEKFKARRVCHIIDSIKNQEELETLELVYRDMLYFVGVYSPLPARVRALEKIGMSQAGIYGLIDQDSGEEFDHGQTVRDTFPQADFFLRVDTDTDAQIAARVERFLHLILGTKVLTP
ncbi:MAG: deoxycytidylate deaminase, partial [Proteobacteria bacterium]|nr:deoxycytidylate deaminase [Pseudomonadota bacterium]